MGLTTIISFITGPWGKWVLAAMLVAGAWIHGYEKGRTVEIDKAAVMLSKEKSAVIAKYESDIKELSTRMDADRKAAETFSAERDIERARNKDLSQSLKKALEKEVYVKCVADDNVVDIINKGLK